MRQRDGWRQNRSRATFGVRPHGLQAFEEVGEGVQAVHVPFRGALQMMVFPDQPIRTVHYHENAPLVMVTGIAMTRGRTVAICGR